MVSIVVALGSALDACLPRTAYVRKDSKILYPRVDLWTGLVQFSDSSTWMYWVDPSSHIRTSHGPWIGRPKAVQCGRIDDKYIHIPKEMWSAGIDLRQREVILRLLRPREFIAEPRDRRVSGYLYRPRELRPRVYGARGPHFLEIWDPAELLEVALFSVSEPSDSVPGLVTDVDMDQLVRRVIEPLISELHGNLAEEYSLVFAKGVETLLAQLQAPVADRSRTVAVLVWLLSVVGVGVAVNLVSSDLEPLYDALKSAVERLIETSL